MDWDDLRLAREQAQETIRLADTQVIYAAKLAAGRLRKSGLDRYWLRQLKKELNEFNAVTGKWSNK